MGAALEQQPAPNCQLTASFCPQLLEYFYPLADSAGSPSPARSHTPHSQPDSEAEGRPAACPYQPQPIQQQQQHPLHAPSNCQQPPPLPADSDQSSCSFYSCTPQLSPPSPPHAPPALLPAAGLPRRAGSTQSTLSSPPASAAHHSDSPASSLRHSRISTPHSSRRSSRAPPSVQITSPSSSPPAPKPPVPPSCLASALPHPSRSASALLQPLRFHRPSSVHLAPSSASLSSLAHEHKPASWRARRHSAVSLNPAQHIQPPVWAHPHHLMSSNQPQLSSANPLSLQKSSSPDLLQSSPSLTAARPVGGIGESPFRPKHGSAGHLLSTTLNHSRLFKQLPSRQRSLTQHGTHPSPSTFQRIHTRNLSTHSSSNTSTFQRTHRKNLSDCPSSESNHPFSSIGRPSTPTLNQLEIPSLIAPTRTRRDNQEPRSIVTSLGLAPISQSTNHPFGFPLHHPSKDSSTKLSSLHGSSNHTGATSDLPRSLSQGSSIPSLLNPLRVKPIVNDQPQIDPQTLPEQTNTTQLTTASDRVPHETPAGTSGPQPLIANHPFQTRATCHPGSNRLADQDAYHPQPQQSHPRQIAPVNPPPSPKQDVTASRARETLEPGVSFEPSGKSFCKYALPKPRLEVTLATPNVTQQSVGDRKRGENHTKPATETCPAVFFPYTTPPTASDMQTEELKERYWNSKTENISAHEVWAEIYISRLERKLWKAQAEADFSVDCLALCLPTGAKGSSTLKPQNGRRRVASASDAEQGRTEAPSSRPKKKTRPRQDQTSAAAGSTNEKVLSKLISCQPSSPLEISDGPLQRLPCISSSQSQSTGAITPYRPEIFSPSHHPSQSILRSAASSRVIRHQAAADFPRNGDSQRGYRIVLPTDSSQQQRTFRRRSRSVPDLRRIHLQLPSPPNSMKDSTGFSGDHTTGFSGDLAYKDSPGLLSHIHRPWPAEDPTSQTSLSIPQTLIDAMFPPASDVAKDTPSYPPENLLSVDSSIRPVRCVTSPKELHKSICATIEVPDNTFTSSRPDSAAANELSEPLPKGPLYSLPRFIEPRLATVVALPPPPRRRNPTPVTSTNSSSQNSFAGTKRSTNDSMVAHLSPATPSEKTSPEFPMPPSVRLVRRSASPLTPPDPSADAIMPNSAPTTGLLFEPPERIRSQSFSSVYPTSPTCESPVDSAHRYSGFFSQVSSRPCSFGVSVPWIDREDRDQTAALTPNRPPLSAIYLTSTPQISQSHAGGDAQPAKTFMDSLNEARNSSHSGGSGSTHSAIDPDKPINQADLFYQVPASPRRSLIQDYDDHIIKSKQPSDEQAGESTSPTVVKRSGLIDEILAGYAGPRRAPIARSRLEPNEPTLDGVEDREETRSAESGSIASHTDSSQHWPRPTVTQRIPRIIDAFEARQSSRSRAGSHSHSH
ncbi:hypothetical protein PTTG_12502 [Puccinia triticina 1-1 BBBD Race 1]|uniref:Uncharacterized protein n=1 Tax=Puccinia triticina (isolate 1-1 / race 1 (BBBD)) TaxID=630390 RepID=A0A180H0V4_PUCT1|nr:hypothetical protein PTTG_12502 [Puccinia triticina 1-1 BBBD Race 1]